MEAHEKAQHRALVTYHGVKAVESAPWTPSEVGFGPGEPLRPAAALEPIRREDYLVGRNMLFTPRAAEQRAITYMQMRNLADSYGILRTIIEKRKDELKGLEWDIAPAQGHEEEDLVDECAQMREFWQYPDGDASFDQWLGILAEDLFVADALCLYINRNKKKEIVSLDTIDGTTMWMLVNDRGRIPDPPEPAYEQNVKGFPRTWWTKNEVIYRPYNLRSMGLYGFSHVESIIMTVNIAFRREVQFLEWFRSSNLPAALIQAPESWTPQQIAEWQMGFDNLLAGNLAARSRMNLVPGGGGVTTFQPLTFDAKFDEWLARVMCARFGVSPTPYVAQVNRAQAQTMEEASKEESLVPITQHFKVLFDTIIQRQMGASNLQFIWTETQHYKLQDAQLDDLLLKSGVITLDNVRRNKGLEPYENDMGSKPLVWTQAGPILLEDIISRAVPAKPTGSAPAPEADIATPQDAVEQDKLPDEQLVKAELKDWERFAIKRLGKKSGREFEPKMLPPALAKRIQSELTAKLTPEFIKAFFAHEAQKAAYWQSFVRDAESFEHKMVNELCDMFRAQFKEVVEKLKTAQSTSDALFNKDKAREDYRDAVFKTMEQALRKGVNDARALLKPTTPHATKQIPSVIPEGALTWLTTRLVWAAKQVDDETEQMLRDELTKGFGAGESTYTIAERVRDVFAQCSDVRAQRIARTEVIAASSQGAVEGYREAGLDQVEVYPAMDERECDLCESLAGVHDITEQYTPPFHPNCRCHPEDTLVYANDIKRVFRRWYNGDLIEITTAFGHKLSGTPNHPILTNAGWVAFGDLREGDYVIGSLLSKRMLRINPDVNDMPTQISKIFDALAVSNLRKRVVGTPMDFHGDGRDDQVDVVSVNDYLAQRAKALGFKHRTKFGFPASHRKMCLARGDASLSRIIESDSVSIANSPSWYVTHDKPSGNYTPIDSVGAGDTHFRFSRDIPSDNLLRIKAEFASPGRRNFATPLGIAGCAVAEKSLFSENGNQTSLRGMIPSAGDLSTFPSEIVSDRIVNIAIRRFSGHVYNLETNSGYYLANNIISHNCVLLPVVE
jgi:SPP1 gp7 family putative phage head morphogenesis protein